MEFGRVFLAVLSILFIFGPVLLILNTVRGVLGMLTQKEVRSVWGRIISLKDEVDSDGSTNPSILYEFEFEGMTIRSRQIYKFGDVFWGSFGTRNLKKHAHIENKSVEVFFFGKDPKHSWIWMEKDWIGIMKSSAATVLFTGSGILMLTLALK